MEELFKLGFGIYEKYGLAGLLLIYFLGDKIIWPRLMQWKKGDNYVSFKDVKELKENLSILNGKIAAHLEKEALEDIHMAKMESEQDHFKESIVELKDNQKATFLMVSEIKNMLIKLKI